MATVHPSRIGLVTGAASSLRNEDKYSGFDRGRDRSSETERRREQDRNYDRDPAYRRDYPRHVRDDSRDRDGHRGRTPEKVNHRRERSPGRERERDEDRRERDRPRRASPDYSSYRREEPPHLKNNNANGHTNANGDRGHIGDTKGAPWREPENMYASRGRGRPPAGGEDFFASRRAERASKEVNIWPPSPKEPSRDPADMKKKRSSKRRRSNPPSSDDDSEEERERRRRKEKKRKEKKEREERKHKRKHRREEKPYDDDGEDDRKHRERRSKSYRSDESDKEDERRRSPSYRSSRSRSEKRRERGRHKSGHSSRAGTPPRWHGDEEQEEDEWEEKPADSFVARAEHTGKSPHMERVPKEEKEKHHQQHQLLPHTVENASASDSEEEVGPEPVAALVTKGKKVDERQYGGALLRGEGSAMAAFLQDGDTQARIPRRGEIGLTPDEIAQFEAVGYVMSGSRHRRMNAVRMRKENQVISAEEKRGILKLQKEERERREAILRDEFRELVEEKLKGTAAASGGPSKNGREE